MIPLGSWKTTAVMCEYLSVTLRYPTEDLAGALMSGELHLAANELMAALGRPVTSVDCHEEPGIDDLFERLRIEYSRMFLTLPHADISPYAGVWHAQMVGAKPMFYFGTTITKVEKAYRSLGFAPGTVEPPDHIAVMLQFLEYVAGMRASIITRPAGVTDEMLESTFFSFVDSHLSSWAPGFAEQVKAHTSENLYRRSSDLLLGFLQVCDCEAAA